MRKAPIQEMGVRFLDVTVNRVPGNLCFGKDIIPNYSGNGC